MDVFAAFWGRIYEDFQSSGSSSSSTPAAVQLRPWKAARARPLSEWVRSSTFAPALDFVPVTLEELALAVATLHVDVDGFAALELPIQELTIANAGLRADVLRLSAALKELSLCQDNVGFVTRRTRIS